MNFLDLFALKLREKRIQQKITQRGLAEKLNMCTRTVIEIENCKSNPKFETVALISKEMRISLDAVVFHDEKPREIPKVVADFFAGKSDAEAERYIALCQSAEKLKNGESKRPSMRIAALTYRIASGHRRTILTRWLLLSAQLERRATFILFFLFVRIPDFFEAVLTDGVFNQAGFVFGDFRVYARSDQLHRKKLVPLVNFLSNFATHIGQMEKVIFIHCEKAAVSQGSHRMAHAGL